MHLKFQTSCKLFNLYVVIEYLGVQQRQQHLKAQKQQEHQQEHLYVVIGDLELANSTFVNCLFVTLKKVCYSLLYCYIVCYIEFSTFEWLETVSPLHTLVCPPW